MKNRKVSKLIGVVMSLMLVVSYFTTTAYAQSSGNNNLDLPTNVQIVEELEDGYKIVTEYYSFVNKSRSTIQTKAMKRSLKDDKNVELCAFYLYGDFNTSTEECVNSYFTTTTSGGQWNVENSTHSHDYYTAYGSFSFVRRILGIKVESRPMNISLTYRT